MKSIFAFNQNWLINLFENPKTVFLLKKVDNRKILNKWEFRQSASQAYRYFIADDGALFEFETWSAYFAAYGMKCPKRAKNGIFWILSPFKSTQ